MHQLEANKQAQSGAQRTMGRQIAPHLRAMGIPPPCAIPRARVVERRRGVDMEVCIILHTV